MVHKWRSEEQAILVGTNTVLEDNPALTTRYWTGNNPIRIVLDQNNKISKESHIFDNQAKTISISKNEMPFDENLEITFCVCVLVIATNTKNKITNTWKLLIFQALFFRLRLDQIYLIIIKILIYKIFRQQ